LVIGELGILRDTVEALRLPITFVEDVATSNPDGSPTDEWQVGKPIPVRSLGYLRSGEVELGRTSAVCGHAAFEYFNHAIDACLRGEAHGIVTAPLNKAAMNAAGHAFVGHTEILEKRVGASDVVMAIWHPRLVVGHVTDHLPLRQALDAITENRIKVVTRLTDKALRDAGRVGPEGIPRIALAGVNPHAGEGGLFGNEEKEILEPAMAKLRAEGLSVSGPYPGDTVFLQGLRGRFEAVIAMYHDQGFGPMKTVDFANGVNCTLGLPFVRTSPDHGTAFEIAGKGVAEPESMVAASQLAFRLLGIRG
jgi:4-hydroxythreonine-4-phosphate dehydrogenase